MVMPGIQIAASIAANGSIQGILPDLQPVYSMYIPKPRGRKLKRYNTTDQNILHHQMNTNERIRPKAPGVDEGISPYNRGFPKTSVLGKQP
jgi:hypothetical protein